jgi:hypothetical protein
MALLSMILKQRHPIILGWGSLRDKCCLLPNVIVKLLRSAPLLTGAPKASRVVSSSCYVSDTRTVHRGQRLRRPIRRSWILQYS